MRWGAKVSVLRSFNVRFGKLARWQLQRLSQSSYRYRRVAELIVASFMYHSWNSQPTSQSISFSTIEGHSSPGQRIQRAAAQLGCDSLSPGRGSHFYSQPVNYTPSANPVTYPSVSLSNGYIPPQSQPPLRQIQVPPQQGQQPITTGRPTHETSYHIRGVSNQAQPRVPSTDIHVQPPPTREIRASVPIDACPPIDTTRQPPVMAPSSPMSLQSPQSPTSKCSNKENIIAENSKEATKKKGKTDKKTREKKATGKGHQGNRRYAILPVGAENESQGRGFCAGAGRC
ncbi:hypothetical protein NMY22_g3913 [Coprinellus aureogranulatus]|nr:hypothetical protein NMY22_g3913 [Coprinellus aureogranulatus]